MLLGPTRAEEGSLATKKAEDGGLGCEEGWRSGVRRWRRPEEGCSAAKKVGGRGYGGGEGWMKGICRQSKVLRRKNPNNTIVGI